MYALDVFWPFYTLGKKLHSNNKEYAWKGTTLTDTAFYVEVFRGNAIVDDAIVDDASFRGYGSALKWQLCSNRVTEQMQQIIVPLSARS